MRAGMSVHGGCGRSPYVNWGIKNERMKRYIFCISLCLGVVSGGRAAAQEPPAEPEAALPLLEVKTNALYWTTASLNAGFEMGLTPRITFEIDAGYNPLTFSDNRKFKFWMIQPEIRHWFRNRFEGHFLGVHLLYADFNVGGMKFLGMSDRRYQGGPVWGGCGIRVQMAPRKKLERRGYGSFGLSSFGLRPLRLEEMRTSPRSGA